MPGKGNPNNGNGKPTKNQINLDEWSAYSQGVFEDLGDLDKKNAKNKVVLGTDGEDSLNVGEINDLIDDLADRTGYGEGEVAEFLASFYGLTVDDYTFLDGNFTLLDGSLDIGDVVALGDGNDQMWAGTGKDIVFGGDGNDVIRGEEGSDLLFGEDGNDVLDAGDDDDLDAMAGGEGNDTYQVYGPDDYVFENADEGDDTVVFNGQVKVDLGVWGTFDNVENYELGDGGVTLVGTGGDDNLIGNDEDNIIDGGGGNDFIDGKGGDDLLIGDDATDGDDTIYGGSGNDTIWGDRAAHFGLTPFGTWDDMLYGESGDDIINGGWGDDTIDGGSDNDVIEGGQGADDIDGGSGNDTASYEHSLLAVSIELDLDIYSGGDAEGDDLDSIENLIGSAGDDYLVGDGVDNIIEGGDGGDDIFGNGGSDTASYASSDDYVWVELDVSGPQIGGDAEGDYLFGIENLIGSAFDDYLTGDDVGNVIDGGDGFDDIEGGDGADHLYGGAGGDDDYISLGEDTSGGAPDPSSLNRDGFTDVVYAEATFAENGSDIVTDYSDGQGGALAIDVFDFTDAMDELGETDPDDAFYVVFDGDGSGDDGPAQIWGFGADEAMGGGDDELWFTISEDGDMFSNENAPESVFIQVDGDTFEWAVGDTDWTLV